MKQKGKRKPTKQETSAKKLRVGRGQTDPCGCEAQSVRNHACFEGNCSGERGEGPQNCQIVLQTEIWGDALATTGNGLCCQQKDFQKYRHRFIGMCWQKSPPPTQLSAPFSQKCLSQKRASGPCSPHTRQQYEQNSGQKMTPNASKQGKLGSFATIYLFMFWPCMWGWGFKIIPY